MNADKHRLAQGAEVSQNAKRQARLFFPHSCLPSMPAASSAGGSLCGPLERLNCRGLAYHAQAQRTRRKTVRSRTAWRSSSAETTPSISLPSTLLRVFDRAMSSVEWQACSLASEPHMLSKHPLVSSPLHVEFEQTHREGRKTSKR
jgi:hypothetical protein